MVQTILIPIFSDTEVELRIAKLGPVANNTSMKCSAPAVIALRLEFNSPGIQLVPVFAAVIEAGDCPYKVGEKREAVGQKEGGEAKA
jgi:hypothetical protein